MRAPRILPVALASVTLGLLAAPAGADVIAPAANATPPVGGAYTTSVGIEVPDYRELTPELSLSYASGGGNGAVGVGWSLTGFSTIERITPGKGTPRYDATDGYMLDGMELVACGPGVVSPSCAAGGTHATKIESYHRISLAGGTWTVTTPSGIRSVYTPLYNPGLGVHRWGLAQRLDPMGNSVGYAWSCTTDCVPSQISYAGASITLAYEARPDLVSYPTGVDVRILDRRLRSIDVKFAGVRARIYRVNYAASALSQRSLVQSIQQYGRDAVVDGTGTPTGGTSLPASTFTYQDASSYAYGISTYVPWAGYVTSGGSWRSGDLDGDGRGDLIHLYPGSNVIASMRANPAGGYTYAAFAPPIPVGGTQPWQGGDVNGDGKYDLIKADGSTIYTFLSTGTGAFSVVPFSLGAGYASTDGTWESGDVNRDGRTDFLHILSAGVVRTYLSNGNGTYGAVQFQPWAGYSTGTGSWQVGDFNGDGRSDFLHVLPTGGVYTWLSNGNGTYAVAHAPVPWGGYAGGGAWFLGDVNGDGKSDLLHLPGAAGPAGAVYSWVSKGNGQFVVVTANVGAATNAGFWRALDSNGDGRTDLVHLGTTTQTIWRGRGDGGFHPPGAWQIVPSGNLAGPNTQYLSADPSGDTAADLIYITGDTIYTLTSQNAPGPNLTSATTGLGGTMTITYAPSSTVANSNNPPVMWLTRTVTASDGRGGVSTTRYDYEGGLYDHADRRFLGFRAIRTTLPCVAGEAACPYLKTWYRQDYGSVSKVERTEQRSGADRLRAVELHEYTTNGNTAPYTSLRTGSWGFQYDGLQVAPACPGPTCLRTYTSTRYDAWGNQSEVITYGDWDVAGDEESAYHYFTPNTAAYLTSYRNALVRYQGVGWTGALLEFSANLFDGQVYGVAPTHGNVTERQMRVNDAGAWIVGIRTGYDAWGNVTSRTDALGNVTTYTFDPTYHLFPVGERNPLGHTSGATWQVECGEPVAITDAHGIHVAFNQYDAMCRPTTTSFAGGSWIQRGYVGLGNPAGQYVETTTPAADGSSTPVWSRTYLDGLGRTYRATRKGVPTDVASDSEYDARGRLTRTSLPYSVGTSPRWASASYDAFDRTTRLTYPDGAFTQSIHGFSGGKPYVQAVDERGVSTFEYFDIYGRKSHHYEYGNGQWIASTQHYDARGFLSRVVDAAGNTSTFEYDWLGRQQRQTLPGSGSTTLSYDANSNLRSMVDARGLRTTQSYDAINRLTTRITADGAPGQEVYTLSYDQNVGGYFNLGRLTSWSAPGGTGLLRYDARGNVVFTQRTMDGWDFPMWLGYDAGGRLRHVTYPDGDTLGSATNPIRYDAVGRVVSIPGFVTSASYDAAGRLTGHNNSNGTSSTYNYSADRGWLSGIQTTRGATTVQNLGYGRDAKGRITQITSPFAGEGWSTLVYDDLDRLTSASSSTSAVYNQSWSYDVLGNLTYNSRVGAYSYALPGKPHAVSSAGGNSYTYDAAGNQLSGAGRTMTWNGAGQLAQVVAGPSLISLFYTPFGDRLKTVEGGTTTWYAGPDVVWPIGNAPITKYVRLAGRIIGKKEGWQTSTPYWIHADHHGSINVVTNSAGAEVLRQSYRPYGELMTRTGSNVEKLAYLGERQDATGLQHFGAREYDPVLGRFLSVDPVIPGMHSSALNRYAYAFNAPTVLSDPGGQSPSDIVVPAGGGGDLWNTTAPGDRDQFGTQGNLTDGDEDRRRERDEREQQARDQGFSQVTGCTPGDEVCYQAYLDRIRVPTPTPPPPVVVPPTPPPPPKPCEVNCNTNNPVVDAVEGALDGSAGLLVSPQAGKLIGNSALDGSKWVTNKVWLPAKFGGQPAVAAVARSTAWGLLNVTKSAANGVIRAVTNGPVGSTLRGAWGAVQIVQAGSLQLRDLTSAAVAIATTGAPAFGASFAISSTGFSAIMSTSPGIQAGVATMMCQARSSCP